LKEAYPNVTINVEMQVKVTASTERTLDEWNKAEFDEVYKAALVVEWFLKFQGVFGE
jgi:hypothetical protein